MTRNRQPGRSGKRFEERFTLGGVVLLFIAFASLGVVFLWYHSDAAVQLRQQGIILALTSAACCFLPKGRTRGRRVLAVTVPLAATLVHLYWVREQDPFIVWPIGPIAWSILCLSAIPFLAGLQLVGIAPLKSSLVLIAMIVGILAAIQLRPQTFPIPQHQNEPFHSASLGRRVPGVGYVGPMRTVIASYYSDNPNGEFERVRTSGPFDLRTLALSTEGDVSARKTTSFDDRRRCRVELDKIVPTAPWRVRVMRLVPNLTAGEHWLLTFRMRADAPRKLSLVVRENASPWKEIAPANELEVGPEWKTFQVPYVISQSLKTAAIEFIIGGSNIACEWDSVLWSCTKTDKHYPRFQFIVNHQLNDEGFRSGQHQIEKGPNQFRVALLGDSFTYGQGVPEGKEFARVVERNLRALAPAGKQVEVLNFGISGYDTEQERLCYEHFASKYHPDLVVLVMFDNDLEPPPAVAWTDGRAGNLPPTFEERVTRSSVNEGFKRCMRHLYHLKRKCDADGANLVVVVLNLFNSPRSREILKILGEVEPELKVPFLDIFVDFQKFGLTLEQTIVHPSDHHCNGQVHQIVGDIISRWLAGQHWVPQKTK